jgi:hypothetical protein
LMDIAEKGGYLTKPKVGWYEAINPATGEVLSEKLMRAKEVQNSKDFWMMMFEKTDFSTYIKNAYTIGASGAIMREDTVEELDDVIDDNDDAAIAS